MKVKVRRGPGLTGSQKNYGLVTGSIWNYEDKPTSNNVGTTLSPVPRDEATIEAERGETVIGDLDNDGMVEHAKIGGKRHSHGGTPLNVPDGSFVFSDYRGLLIKNKDVLKNIFNMNSSKAVTPAKVAQRYEINKFKNMLNDPFIDPIDRKTAQLMIDNNMKKLGQLALIQEGMKGFPDGIPAIAQPLMGSDFAQQGGQQMMRRGGIVSYKKGGLAKYQIDNSIVSGANDMRQIPINLQAPDQDPNFVYGPYRIPEVTVRPSASRDWNNDGYNDELDAAYQQQMMQNVFGDVNYQLPANDQGTISQTPDYKIPGTFNYYANNAADIAMNPGSYLMYLMTPGDQGRFGTYLQDNTNAVGSGLDFWAASQTGLMPYVGGLTTQLFAQNPKLFKQFMYGDNDPNTQKAGFTTGNEALDEFAGKMAMLYGARLGFKALKNSGVGKKLGELYTKGKYKVFPGLDPNNPHYLEHMEYLEKLRKYSKTKAFIKKYGTVADDELADPTTLERMFGTNRKLRAVGNALKSTGKFIGKGIPYINPFSPNGKGIPGAAALWQVGDYLHDKNFVEPYEIPDDALDNKGADATQQIQEDVDMINYTPRNLTAPVKNVGTTTVKEVPGTQKVRVRTGTTPPKDAVIIPRGNAVRLNMDSVNQYQSGNNEVPEEELGGSLGMYQGQNRSQVFTQFTPESQILNTPNYTVIGPKTKIPYGFTVQHFDPKKGYYTITNPDTGETMPFDMDDFVNIRQGELLDEYAGGRNAWRENALSLDEKTREAANDWFQGRYEDWRRENNLPSYFYGKPGKDPYGRDKKFGIYTYSAPGIKRKVNPDETPQPQPDSQPEETKIAPGRWEKTKAGYPGPRYADIIGEGAAANQRFQRYPSVLAAVENAPYETIYRKYNGQPTMGAYTTALQNAGTGPDSARNIDNVTGKVLEAIAQGQEQTEEQVNNPRFLDMLARQQQAKLQTSAANAAEKLRYFDDFRSTGQDYDANWNAIQSLNAKMKAQTADHQEKLALIKAMYPYANLDFDETPTANATLRSITDTPITGAGATGSDAFSSQFQTLVSGFMKQGLSEEKAVEQANAYMRNYIAMTKAGTAGAMTDPFGLLGL